MPGLRATIFTAGLGAAAFSVAAVQEDNGHHPTPLTPSPWPPCDQRSTWCPPPQPPLPPPPSPPKRICKTCHKPLFTWDKLPVFFHGCQRDGPNGGLIPDTLDIVEHFPLVTLEKWQGDSVVPYIYEEDAWIVAAKQIKEVNPTASVIVWLDSVRIYTSNKTLNPDLGQACTTGHFHAATYVETHRDMLLTNTSGQPALDPWSKCHIYDFIQPEVRTYWTQLCLNLTHSGYIDGCGADASWQRDPTGSTTSPWVEKRWDVGHRQMMRDTTLALGDGVLLGKTPWEVGQHVNGALHESCDASNVTINTLRNLTALSDVAARKQHVRGSTAGSSSSSTLTGPYIYECHASCNTITDCRNSVAAFLIGAGPYQFWGRGDWKGPYGHYIPELMEPKLGIPDGDAVYDTDTKVWTRTFGGGELMGGTTVTFDVTSNTGTISWPTTMMSDVSAGGGGMSEEI